MDGWVWMLMSGKTKEQSNKFLNQSQAETCKKTQFPL